MTAKGINMIDGKICSHTPTMFKSTKLTAYEIIQCLYVDDGAFPFSTRGDLQRGMDLIHHHFGRFGLDMHIGQGALTSKTECVFFPPPQFFQHSQQCAAAATIIQRTFRRTSNRAMQIRIEQPAQSSTCPTDFHIGHRVTVTSSHSTHTCKTETVCRHPKKYVMFTPNEHPTDIIRILPKSLAAYHLDGQCMINSFDDDKDHDPGQTEREHEMYDRLDETKDFPVADGFVSFTQMFRYLGSLISYNLRDDDDITARIAKNYGAIPILTCTTNTSFSELSR